MSRILVIVILIFGLGLLFTLPEQGHPGAATSDITEQIVATQKAAPIPQIGEICLDEHLPTCHALVLIPDANAPSPRRAMASLFADARAVLDGTVFGREPRPPRL